MHKDLGRIHKSRRSSSLSFTCVLDRSALKMAMLSTPAPRSGSDQIWNRTQTTKTRQTIGTNLRARPLPNLACLLQRAEELQQLCFGFFLDACTNRTTVMHVQSTANYRGGRSHAALSSDCGLQQNTSRCSEYTLPVSGVAHSTRALLPAYFCEERSGRVVFAGFEKSGDGPTRNTAV